MSFPSGPVQRPQSPTPPAPRRSRFGRFIIMGLQFALLSCLVAFGVMWWYWGRDLPHVSDLDILEFTGKTQVFDRKGEFITILSPSLNNGKDMNRRLLKLEEISPWLQKSVVTNEDRRFFEHRGVDYIGIARGLIKGLLQNDLEGGSSITQQVIKNTLLADMGGARTAERKFKEAILAFRLESTFPKERILNAYLNIVYWGNGGSRNIVGISGASQAYFGKTAKDLNLAESVYLATLIPGPNRRYKNFKNYRSLMKSLMERMVEDGRITRIEANNAWATPIYPAGWQIVWNDDGSVASARLSQPQRLINNIRIAEKEGYRNQHFIQAVERKLLPLVGRKVLYGGGKIYTTLDVQVQRAAEQASLNAKLPAGATLGMALVNPSDGEVLALVGQKLRDGMVSDWDNSTRARRQVGSSIKPLLYTLALEQGWKQYDTILDAPLRGPYQPMNYSRTWLGVPVTLRYALDHSLNLPTVRLGQKVGIPKFENKLRALGFTPPKDGGLSLAIGTLEASPLEMASAYATFANGGKYFQPSFVRSFKGRKSANSREQVLYQRPTLKPDEVWDRQTAWLGLDMLMGIVYDMNKAQGGLATRARIDGWQVGGKTGTTNEIRDVWFAGVTPEISAAVWVGKQEGGQSLPSWVTSGNVPTPIWQEAVAGALKGRTVSTFQEPDGINYQWHRRIKMAVRDDTQRGSIGSRNVGTSTPTEDADTEQIEQTEQTEQTAQPAASPESPASSESASTTPTSQPIEQTTVQQSENTNAAPTAPNTVTTGTVIEAEPVDVSGVMNNETTLDNQGDQQVQSIPVFPAGSIPTNQHSQPTTGEGTEVPVMPAVP